MNSHDILETVIERGIRRAQESNLTTAGFEACRGITNPDDLGELMKTFPNTLTEWHQVQYVWGTMMAHFRRPTTRFFKDLYSDVMEEIVTRSRQ